MKDLMEVLNGRRLDEVPLEELAEAGYTREEYTQKGISAWRLRKLEPGETLPPPSLEELVAHPDAASETHVEKKLRSVLGTTGAQYADRCRTVPNNVFNQIIWDLEGMTRHKSERLSYLLRLGGEFEDPDVFKILKEVLGREGNEEIVERFAEAKEKIEQEMYESDFMDRLTALKRGIESGVVDRSPYWFEMFRDDLYKQYMIATGRDASELHESVHKVYELASDPQALIRVLAEIPEARYLKGSPLQRITHNDERDWFVETFNGLGQEDVEYWQNSGLGFNESIKLGSDIFRLVIERRDGSEHYIDDTARLLLEAIGEKKPKKWMEKTYNTMKRSKDIVKAVGKVYEDEEVDIEARKREAERKEKYASLMKKLAKPAVAIGMRAADYYDTLDDKLLDAMSEHPAKKRDMITAMGKDLRAVNRLYKSTGLPAILLVQMYHEGKKAKEIREEAERADGWLKEHGQRVIDSLPVELVMKWMENGELIDNAKEFEGYNDLDFELSTILSDIDFAYHSVQPQLRDETKERLLEYSKLEWEHEERWMVGGLLKCFVLDRVQDMTLEDMRIAGLYYEMDTVMAESNYIELDPADRKNIVEDNLLAKIQIEHVRKEQWGLFHDVYKRIKKRHGSLEVRRTAVRTLFNESYDKTLDAYERLSDEERAELIKGKSDDNGLQIRVFGKIGHEDFKAVDKYLYLTRWAGTRAEEYMAKFARMFAGHTNDTKERLAGTVMKAAEVTSIEDMLDFATRNDVSDWGEVERELFAMFENAPENMLKFIGQMTEKQKRGLYSMQGHARELSRTDPSEYAHFTDVDYEVFFAFKEVHGFADVAIARVSSLDEDVKRLLAGLEHDTQKRLITQVRTEHWEDARDIIDTAGHDWFVGAFGADYDKTMEVYKGLPEIEKVQFKVGEISGGSLLRAFGALGYDNYGEFLEEWLRATRERDGTMVEFPLGDVEKDIRLFVDTWVEMEAEDRGKCVEELASRLRMNANNIPVMIGYAKYLKENPRLYTKAREARDDGVRFTDAVAIMATPKREKLYNSLSEGYRRTFVEIVKECENIEDVTPAQFEKIVEVKGLAGRMTPDDQEVFYAGLSEVISQGHVEQWIEYVRNELMKGKVGGGQYKVLVRYNDN